MKPHSPARQYTLSMMFWMTLYVAAIIFDGFYFRNRTFLGVPQSPLLYIFAIMPAFPIGGSILAMLRFIENSDEYVRAYMARRFILTTGLTLFITTAWGFLQNYAGVQHFDLYYVYILFWFCFGIVTAISSVLGK
jgi:hypothetical protein